MSQWMRGAALAFVLAATGWAQGGAGDWMGTLKVGDDGLRLIVHLVGGPQGLAGTLDSLD